MPSEGLNQLWVTNDRWVITVAHLRAESSVFVAELVHDSFEALMFLLKHLAEVQDFEQRIRVYFGV